MAGDERLPRTGFLYFWYAGAAFTWGFDPKDRGSFRVEYVPDEVVKLKRAAVPKGHTRGSGDLRTKPYLLLAPNVLDQIPIFYNLHPWQNQLKLRDLPEIYWFVQTLFVFLVLLIHTPPNLLAQTFHCTIAYTQYEKQFDPLLEKREFLGAE